MEGGSIRKTVLEMSAKGKKSNWYAQKRKESDIKKKKGISEMTVEGVS